MATPEFSRAVQNINVQQAMLQTIDFGIAKDVAGAPVDVSAYDASLNAYPVGLLPGDAKGVDLSWFNTGNFTLGVDGSVKLTVPTTFDNEQWSGRYNYILVLTNDTFTTSQVIRRGILTLTPQAA